MRRLGRRAGQGLGPRYPACIANHSADTVETTTLKGELLARDLRLMTLEARLSDDGVWHGSADFGAVPNWILGVFIEFDNLVNDGVFALLDLVDGVIEGLQLNIKCEDGRHVRIAHFQPFPTAGLVSFTILDGDAEGIP